MARWLRTLFGSGQPPLALDPESWQEVMRLPLFTGLDDAERTRLRQLAGQLLADKTFNGAGGFQVDARTATWIAAQASLPVLNLGYAAYQGWDEIIVYPGEFVPEREIVDEHGVVHHVRQPMSGEAWEGGPMVLSWQDVAWSGQGEGYSVVIHEFAHKLDMKQGAVNGLPPMHSDLRTETWADVFGAAYADFCARVDAGEAMVIDPYASESPAEFFAVLSEYFFDWPQPLHAEYPAVYALLCRYYLQNPLQRRESA